MSKSSRRCLLLGDEPRPTRLDSGGLPGLASVAPALVADAPGASRNISESPVADLIATDCYIETALALSIASVLSVVPSRSTGTVADCPGGAMSNEPLAAGGGGSSSKLEYSLTIEPSTLPSATLPSRAFRRARVCRLAWCSVPRTGSPCCCRSVC